MKLSVFDTHSFERPLFEKLNAKTGFEITYLEPRLTSQTAGSAKGSQAVCAFANDKLDAACLRILKEAGVGLIALRSAGFNHVDLAEAARLGLKVARVPAYSPYAVAEHAVCLLLALNRKVYRAYNRVRELNFSLDGLMGFDLHGKTVGIVGTGKIGSAFARICHGFGCELLAYDPFPKKELQTELGLQYVSLPELYQRSRILSLHLPLTPETRHCVDARAFSQMQPGTLLINTGRGALIDTHALIDALKCGQLHGAGLDVYEEEENLFFHDHSGEILQDDQLARLLTFPNVIITAHQGFLTEEAVGNIVETTLENCRQYARGERLENEVSRD